MATESRACCPGSIDLWQNAVPFKHYGDYLKKISERVKKASTRACSEAGLPVIYVREAGVDKDEYARRVAAERGIGSGPVCVLSVLEPCPTFEYVKSKIVRRKRPCHVLNHYGWDQRLGWMHARIQTWFPVHIQIGINGREWLAQQMRQAGGVPAGEKLFYADRGFSTRAGTAEPATANRLGGPEIFSKYPTPYYWTCYQSEWATDIVFNSGAELKRRMHNSAPFAVFVKASPVRPKRVRVKVCLRWIWPSTYSRRPALPCTSPISWNGFKATSASRWIAKAWFRP